ncbi:MAG: Asp-tRNA(Asn)/Glu-tRNA(Gln) amidotransferase subunit GatB [Planctomycetota bacterium]|nr:Asp-tRNA(Asn)/Glu-tRNA(Gln) amidotransferase subunit GatB [Planctomycetota bacterium]
MDEVQDYTMIVGLEVHVQLLTESKLFCRCASRYGAPPNTLTCPVCTGAPGALPVMNRRAYDLSVRAALGLNCDIPTFTKWDRKNYFYPDLPKGFQTSQFDLPLSQNGFLEITDPGGAFTDKRIGIIRAHLEEDAGKSMHDEINHLGDTRIDLNRCGTPLLEIVSAPDLRSAEEASVYLSELKLLLSYLEVSDCNMQEGSLRVDANVNLHITCGAEIKATPIVEVKNMNSFRAVARALDYESERQFESWKENGRCLGDPGVTKETRGWDDGAGLTRSQRSKEESSDYRYFPEPDLPPVVISDEEIDRHRSELARLPSQWRSRLVSEYSLAPHDASVLVNQGKGLVSYLEEIVDINGDAKLASNWIQQDVMRYLSENSIDISEYPITASSFAHLLGTIQDGTLSTSRAREVLACMLESNQSVDEAMARLGIAEVDSDETEMICRELLESNPQVVADLKDGKLKAVGAIIGKAKQKNPNIQPQQVREICLRLVETMP